jgi:hypothetical protein
MTRTESALAVARAPSRCVDMFRPDMGWFLCIKDLILIRASLIRQYKDGWHFKILESEGYSAVINCCFFTKWPCQL